MGAFLVQVDFKSAEFTGTLVRLVHLAAFSAWLGTQIWVTFFAGITMFRILSRKNFSAVQGVLFPKYFALGVILVGIAMVTFILDNPAATWTTQNKIQVTCLTVCLLSTGLNLVYVEPQASHVQRAKLKIEAEEGADQCIGKVDPDKLKVLETNAHYVALSKKFGMLHALSSISNLIGLASQVLHIWYLAANLKSI
ncbi:hypothetical protein EMCRGX_G034208 [Ephydatia muelleri]